MTEPNEVIHFERIKSGDLGAFEVLFKQHYQDIFRYAYRFVSNDVVAEEIAQEVFMYIWEKRQQISIESSLVSYLYSAARNKSINYLKLELPKINNRSDIYEIDIEDENITEIVEDSDQLRKVINSAISELPAKCKEIFMMSRYEGLTYDEIAEEMSLSKKTVENQMGIALKKLRESLKPLLAKIKS
ncbi:MAG: RNA polymerase sigma-70 factor [Cyclobacteriaceae bacterium]|nr:RNA polymerase sigma-70 factor [Cyclobacteriaceae bacterium HetDA_MAG_MS6]